MHRARWTGDAEGLGRRGNGPARDMHCSGDSRVVSGRDTAPGASSRRPTKDDMADEEVIDDDPVEAGDSLDEDPEEDEELVEVDDEELGDVLVADLDTDVVEVEGAEEADEEEEVDPPVPAAKAADDEEEDEEEDSDDVEEDLSVILKERIAAGADDDEDEEEEGVIVDDRSETGDKVPPRSVEEFSCNECFLLVRRSQFSARRTDCPGGLDGADCPVKRQLGLA